MVARPTKAQLKAMADAEALAQEQYADIVDANSLSPALAALRSKFNVEGDLDVSVYVYLCNADDQGNDFRVWESDDPDTYNLKSIARKFGSGRYRLRVYATTPEGGKPCVINRVQGVLLTPEEDAKVQAAKEAAKNPQAAPVQNNNSELREMLGGLKEAVMLAINRPQLNPLEQFQQFAALMKTLMPAQTVAAAPDPFTQLAGMMGLMEKLKSITGGNAPEGATATETLMLEAARAVLPALASGLTKQPAPSEPQPAPVSVAALEAPKVELPIDEEAEQMKIIDRLKVEGFKLQLIAANKAAARGVDPVTYADGIYDMFDDADIHGIATQANWFAMMCEAVPGCKVHEVWYGAMRGAIIDIAVEDGALLRDEAGGLTVPTDSGTTDASEPEGGTHGAVDAGTGSAAAESKPV